MIKTKEILSIIIIISIHLVFFISVFLSVWFISPATVGFTKQYIKTCEKSGRGVSEMHGGLYCEGIPSESNKQQRLQEAKDRQTGLDNLLDNIFYN